MFYGTHYSSPVGDILLAADDKSIIGLWIENQKYIGNTMPDGIEENNSNDIICQGVKWLDAYFAGDKPDISELSLAPRGNDFRQCVWKIITEIQYGKLATYSEVAKKTAERLGKRVMSAQAVGGAIAHNPISIIIPCHRVVGSSGSLTGYAGGIDKKILLLKHEEVDMDKLFIPKKN